MNVNGDDEHRAPAWLVWQQSAQLRGIDEVLHEAQLISN